MTTINGAYSLDANGWVSETLELTGNAILEVLLPGKGRVVIKKSETRDGPWPKCLITKWAGPLFRFRLLHGRDKQPSSENPGGHNRFVKIITTETPIRIQYANI